MDNQNSRNRFDNPQNGVRTIVSSRFRQQNSDNRSRFNNRNSAHEEQEEIDHNNQGRFQNRFNKAPNRGRQSVSRFQNHRNENDLDKIHCFENETNEIYENEPQQQNRRFNTNDSRNNASDRNNGTGKRYLGTGKRYVAGGNSDRFEQQLIQQQYIPQQQKYPSNQYTNPSLHRNGYNQQQRNNYYNQQNERSYNGAQMPRYSGPLRTDIPPPPNNTNNQFVDSTNSYPMGNQPHYANPQQPQQGHFTPHMLQPTNVMYFQQQPNQQPQPQMIATRRVLHIAPPEQH